MQPTFLTLTLHAVTLAFELAAPWGERLDPAVLAQVPAPGERAPPDQAAPQVTPSPGGIALSRGADGSGRQKIFSLPNRAYQPPQWAADGQSLFVNDFFSLLQIDLAGQELARPLLTTFTGESAVSSSDRFVLNPQTPQLWAFTMGVPETSGATDALFLFDTRTQKRTRLTPAAMIASHPCWSLDGQYLYFIGSRGPLYQKRESPARFYRLNRDGNGLTELPPDDAGND